MPASRAWTYLICNVHGAFAELVLLLIFPVLSVAPVPLPAEALFIFCVLPTNWRRWFDNVDVADDWVAPFSVAWYAWKRSSAINVIWSTVKMWSSRTRTHDTDLLNTSLTCELNGIKRTKHENKKKMWERDKKNENQIIYAGLDWTWAKARVCERQLCALLRALFRWMTS